MKRWSQRANAVDVEFLVAGDDRHIVVLQARPYRVVYSRGTTSTGRGVVVAMRRGREMCFE
jgi:hypothetical protein